MQRIVQVAVVAGLGVLLLTGGIWSYVKTAGRQVVDAVKKEVPLEFEIERTRDLVKDLVPEIRKNIEIVSTEAVEVEQLGERVVASKEQLVEQKAEILRLQGDLRAGKPVYVYGGTEYSSQQVKHDLANKFERYKNDEASSKSLSEIKETRVENLRVARRKLDKMVETKRQLEVQVEQLESRLRTQEVAMATSNVHLDESKVGRAKKAIEDLGKRLEVADRVLNAETAYFGQIELDTAPQTENIEQEVAEYFGTEATIADARQ